jgi:hypothetical protein
MSDKKDLIEEKTNSLLQNLIEEDNPEKIEAIVELFNSNQKKKTALRIDKVSNLLDTTLDTLQNRFENRSQEITTKECLDAIKVLHDSIEKNQKSINDKPEAPLIQFNTQNNELNLNQYSNLDIESRNRIYNVVLQLLNETNKENKTNIDFEDKTSDSGV